MEGWIKIHRKIKDNWVWKNPIYLKGWLYILIEASYNNDDSLGQLMLPIGELAKEMGCNYFTAYRFVQKLQSEGMVIYGEKDDLQNKSQNKVQKLTICKYEEYQALLQSKVQSKVQNKAKENTPIPLKENNNKENKEPPYNPPKGYEIFDFNFLDREFAQVFFMWLTYKYDTFKDRYKSQQSIQACYNNLLKLSHNDPKIAFDVVSQSMANNWKGLFELKTSNNGNIKTTSEQREAAEYDKAARIIARLGSENSGGYGDLWEHQ